MKEYAKMMMYAYPLLATVEKDYEDHIRNRAVLSYFADGSAYEQAEYVAEQIIEMRKLEELKGRVGEALTRLSALERVLVDIRYFGKTKDILAALALAESGTRTWTERTYFRRQTRLGEKLEGLLRAVGLTEEVFRREYENTPTFQHIRKCLEGGGEERIFKREREGVCAKPLRASQ